MKTHYAFLSFCLVLMTSIAYGQLTGVQDYESKLSYTEFETDYYLIDQKDLDRVALIDKVKLKEIKWEREYEKFVNENDEKTTIIKHISSEGNYEDWMEVPEIVVIDKDGLSLFSEKGERINQIDHTPKYLELSKNLSNDLLPLLSFPGREEIEKMKQAGLIVEEDGNTVIISFPYQEISFNEDQLFAEIRDKNENGEIVHITQRSYMQLASGEMVLERIRESTIETLRNDVIAEHVFLRIFSNYRYENTYSKSQGNDADKILKIVFNSDQSKARLEYQPFSKQNRSEIIVYNVSGSVLKTLQTDHSGRAEIDLSDLSPGVYIMRIQSAGRTLSEKFVKL